MTGLSIVKSLDYLLVQPGITRADVSEACTLASEYHLASVVVFPVHVRTAADLLSGSDTKVCAAIGFPYGQESIPTKLVAIEQALSDGADDMAIMLDVSAITEGELARSTKEIESLCSNFYWGGMTSSRGRAETTFVVETMACQLSSLQELWQALDASPAGFVQTSSGHQTRAVTVDHIEELRAALPDGIAVKAVGGVATLDDAQALLTAGAVRVGTASAITIAHEERAMNPGRGRR